MKLANNYLYPNDAPSEILERMAQDQARNLLDGMLSHIDKDKWYAIRWTDIGYEKSDPFTLTKTMQIEIEPIREKNMIWVSPEETYLYPMDAPFMQKLKNCIRYMRDKTGGKWEEREAE